MLSRSAQERGLLQNLLTLKMITCKQLLTWYIKLRITRAELKGIAVCYCQTWLIQSTCGALTFRVSSDDYDIDIEWCDDHDLSLLRHEFEELNWFLSKWRVGRFAGSTNKLWFPSTVAIEFWLRLFQVASSVLKCAHSSFVSLFFSFSDGFLNVVTVRDREREGWYVELFSGKIFIFSGSPYPSVHV